MTVQKNKFIYCVCSVLFVLLVSACASGDSGDAVTPLDSEPSVTAQSSGATDAADSSGSASQNASSAAGVNQPAIVSSIPVALSIPDVDLTTRVVEMGWIVTEVAGERTTRWEIPYTEAGWHVNSAGAGTNGNVIISGHQVVGEAIFAPLALGEVEVGQEILLTDIRGEVFRYDVTEVTEPIPLAGAGAEEEALAESYISQSSQPKLTLMTGWPDFATTHYLFVIADYVGVAE